DEELHRGGQPQAVPDRRPRLAESQGQDGDSPGQEGRLPEVIEDGGDHDRFPLFALSSCSRRSASRTSSSVSFPASIRWVITGMARPSVSPSTSSSSRLWVDALVTRASKIRALPIFLVRCTAPLASSR